MTTQPKDLMTLEETIGGLSLWRKSFEITGSHSHLTDENVPVLLNVFASALHHLEAGRRECQCDAFTKARELGTDNESWGSAVCIMEDMNHKVFRIGHGMPAIEFCPWCGGKVPSTVQPTEEVKG